MQISQVSESPAETNAPEMPPAPEETPGSQPAEAEYTELTSFDGVTLLRQGDQIFLRKGSCFGTVPYRYAEEQRYSVGYSWQGFGDASYACVLGISSGSSAWVENHCLLWNGTDWVEIDRADVLLPYFSGILDRSQVEQYIQAQDLALLLFGGNTSKVFHLPGGSETAPEETYSEGDWTYQAVGGRYARWENLQTAIGQSFMEDWWARKNDVPVYVEHDGFTYALDSEYGDSSYNDRFRDTYQLVEKTEDRIAFTVTGHYSMIWPMEGESLEERDHRLETAPEWTVSYPITMVRTADGWRFESFYVPADPTDASAMGQEAEQAWESGAYVPQESIMAEVYCAEDLRLLKFGNQLYLGKGDRFGVIPYTVENGARAYAGGSWQGFGQADGECLVTISRGTSLWAENHCFRWSGTEWEEVDRVDILAPLLDGVLDREQAEQYLRAQDLALLLFGGDTSKVRGLPGGTEEAPEQQYTQGDWIYQAANGPYAKWADLQAAIGQLFTEDWFAEKNAAPAYVEHDGYTYSLSSEYGDGSYNPRFPDTYSLTEKTEDKISFTVTGHYSWIWPIGDETYEERDQRLENAPDWTVDYPITLVRTENGWRFQQFHVPADPTEAAAFGREAQQAWEDAHMQ